MDNLPRPVSCILGLTMCLFLLGTASARADDPVEYPKAAPLLTISPTAAGFSAESTEGDDAPHLLRLPNEDGEKFPTVLMLTMGKEKTLKEDLNNFSHGNADSMKLTGAHYDTETQIKLPFSSQTESASGERDGESFTVTAVAIRLKNQDVIAIAASPSGDVEAAQAKLTKLLKTIKPVETTQPVAKGNASGPTPLGKSLVELDSHIKLTAANDDWKAMGQDWVDQTTACADPACVAGQLATLEEHLKWEAVDPAWKKRRDSWVEECKNAKTGAEVSKLLLDFEQTVGWKAVDEQWKGLRDGWVAAVKKD
ncbi:MAG: hypothetical protein QOH39_3689 [Verrucomicrobiota bacterium]